VPGATRASGRSPKIALRLGGGQDFKNGAFIDPLDHEAGTGVFVGTDFLNGRRQADLRENGRFPGSSCSANLDDRGSLVGQGTAAPMRCLSVTSFERAGGDAEGIGLPSL